MKLALGPFNMIMKMRGNKILTNRGKGQRYPFYQTIQVKRVLTTRDHNRVTTSPLCFLWKFCLAVIGPYNDNYNDWNQAELTFVPNIRSNLHFLYFDVLKQVFFIFLNRNFDRKILVCLSNHLCHRKVPRVVEGCWTSWRIEYVGLFRIKLLLSSVEIPKWKVRIFVDLVRDDLDVG